MSTQHGRISSRATVTKSSAGSYLARSYAKLNFTHQTFMHVFFRKKPAKVYLSAAKVGGYWIDSFDKNKALAPSSPHHIDPHPAEADTLLGS